MIWVSTKPLAPAVLRQVLLFRTFDEAQIAQVAALLVEQHYRKGAILFHQGDPGGCLHIIGSGRVRVYLSDAEGREVTIRIYGTGSHVGEFSVLDGAPRSASTAAFTPVTTYVLYRDHFLHLLQTNSALVERVLATLTERLRYTTTYSERLVFLSTPQRVAAMLVQLADLEDASDPVRLRLTQHDLATLVCATREAVNHALRDLADQRFIRIERGAVVVLDRAALQHVLD
ncbi:MAG: Crp/Fnr family transcriptional regulator [Blastochloris sp.]|nr:Crp/Fnr family transcriptional regulator [Blastochloris sp.]